MRALVSAKREDEFIPKWARDTTVERARLRRLLADTVAAIAYSANSREWMSAEARRSK